MSEGLYCALLIGLWSLVAMTLMLCVRHWIIFYPRVLSDSATASEQTRKFPRRWLIGCSLVALLAVLTFRILVEMHKL